MCTGKTHDLHSFSSRVCEMTSRYFNEGFSPLSMSCHESYMTSSGAISIAE